jgi:hypothetical protein
MNRRHAIGGVVAAAAAAPLLKAQGNEVSAWVAWWERSKEIHAGDRRGYARGRL